MTATFDAPASYRSRMPRQWMLNVVTAMTFVVLVIVQVAWWPLLRFTLPTVTVAVATPLLAFVPAGLIARALRNSELHAWGVAHGFAVVDRPDWPIPALDVAPFTIARARRKRIVAAMTGRIGDFDAWYVFYTWLNNNRVQVSTHYRHVYALRLPHRLPPLSIGPTISPAAGTTVRFESITFNEHWWVTSPDERFAKAAITPRTMDRLLATDIPVTATTRIALIGQDLVAISLTGARNTDITRMYTALRIIAEEIPPYVYGEFAQ